ncbi:hypothetical protein CRYUN_Cryun24cG0121800 [Craigia yunnanensis]
MAQGGRDNTTVIDVESLASSMKNKIMGNQLSLSPDHCIFRTPSILVKHRKEAYVPNCFSFGPFHHDQPNLKVTEKIKLKYLQGILSSNPEEVLRVLLDSIKGVEGKARNCYAGNIDQDVAVAGNFVEMLVVDGCFIIELFRKDSNVPKKEDGGVVQKEDDDPIFSMSCMLQFLHHDLILLENQIPWFALEILFKKTKGPSETDSLIKLALQFLGNLFSSRSPLDWILKLFVDQKVKHILDLLRLSFVLPSEEVKNYERKRWLYQQKLAEQQNLEGQQNLEWQSIPSVTRLQEAGVKFVRVNADSILDMKFRYGALEIPSLLIQETTETIFRNLISYEQCLSNCRPIFTSYTKIMDNLIDTSNDMEILCKKKIFDNWLSPEDATEFFNKLYNDTYVKSSTFGKFAMG